MDAAPGGAALELDPAPSRPQPDGIRSLESPLDSEATAAERRDEGTTPAGHGGER